MNSLHQSHLGTKLFNFIEEKKKEITIAKAIQMQATDNQVASTSSANALLPSSVQSIGGTQVNALSMSTWDGLMTSMNDNTTNNPMYSGAFARPVASQYPYNQQASTSSAPFPSLQSTDDIDFESILNDSIQSGNNVANNQMYSGAFAQPVAPQYPYNQVASTSSASFPSLQSTDDIDFESILNDSIQSGNNVANNPMYSGAFAQPVAQIFSCTRCNAIYR